MGLVWKVIVGTGTLVGLATGLATIAGGLASNWTDAWRSSRSVGGVLLYVGVVVVAPAFAVVYRRRLFPLRRWRRGGVVGLVVGFVAGLYPFCLYILVDDWRNGSWDLFFFDMRYAGAFGLAFAAIGVPYFVVIGYLDHQRSRKSCPDCWETVKAQACVCRYCGYRWKPLGNRPPHEVIAQ